MGFGYQDSRSSARKGLAPANVANTPHSKSAVGRPSSGGLLAARCSSQRFDRGHAQRLRSRRTDRTDKDTDQGHRFLQRRSLLQAGSLLLASRAAATERRPHRLDRGPRGPCSRAGARPAAEAILPRTLAPATTAWMHRAEPLTPVGRAAAQERGPQRNPAALAPEAPARRQTICHQHARHLSVGVPRLRCGLTPCSRRGPTAGRPRPVVHFRPVPAVCRPRLSSNVRPVKCECQSANH